MSAPQAVGTIPDRQDPPSVPITPFDASVYFTDIDALATKTWSISGLPGSTGLSINSSTAVITGTPTAADSAASPISATVTLTTSTGPVGNLSVTINVSGTPTAAANHYISPVSGSDSSGDGSIGSPWGSVTPFNQVDADPAGHTLGNCAGGESQSGKVWSPNFSGDDSTHTVGLTVNGGGVHTMYGPSGGIMDDAIVIPAGREHLRILRPSDTSYLMYDGQVQFGTSGGQVSKGDAPENVASIRRGLRISGQHVHFDVVARRTAGWQGIFCASTADDVWLTIDGDQHGTPYYPDGNDSGDYLETSQSMPATSRIYLTGGSSGREMKHGGHSIWGIAGGRVSAWGYALDNDWSDIPTFATGDGNRTMFVHRRATNCRFYTMAFNRGGLAQDQPIMENLKLEGTRNTIIGSVIRNPHFYAILSDSASWSWHSRFNGIAHCVVEHVPGPILASRDYLDDSAAGNTRLNDFRILNCIFRNIAQNTVQWDDEVLRIVCSAGVDWRDVIQMHYVTIEDASRTTSSLYVNILRGINPPGKISLATAMSSYAANFSNITVVTDAKLGSAPAASANADPTTLHTDYELDAGDTASLGQGGPIAQVASGDSGTGTTLILTDSRFLPDPSALPDFGEFASGVYVSLPSGDRQVTAYNPDTHSVTIASSISRSAGQDVYLSTASGTNNNRGVRIAS